MKACKNIELSLNPTDLMWRLAQLGRPTVATYLRLLAHYMAMDVENSERTREAVTALREAADKLQD